MNGPADVDHIADALGLRVVDRLAGGHFGAFHVRTTAGARAVLKVLPDWPSMALDRVRTAADLVAQLRNAGYPAPRFLAVGEIAGHVYTVQEFVDGSVPESLTPSVARELLDLWRTHQGAAPRASDGGWGEAVLARAHAGEDLRTASSDPRVLAVLDRVHEVAGSCDPRVFRVGDIVHGDFHAGNLLVRGSTIAAVIDWEEACVGDGRADLVRVYAGAATWLPPESPVLALLRKELDDTTPAEVWLPIGAEIAVHHLRYGLFAAPGALDWVLREAAILLQMSS